MNCLHDVRIRDIVYSDAGRIPFGVRCIKRGEVTMLRKVFALTMAVILVFCLSACSRGEKKDSRHAFGIRQYRYSIDDDGTFTREDPYMEYEDLGTERSKSTFLDRDKPNTLDKWYYDSTGEKLLREVHWERNNPTEAIEYDEKGRVVRVSKKVEEDNVPLDFSYVEFSFPDEYFFHTPRYKDGWQETSILRDMNCSIVREIITEYAYDSDTGRLISMKTSTDNEKVCGEMTFGEGDIILSAKLRTLTSRYDESFENGKSAWYYYENDEVINSGVRTYDFKGRLLTIEVTNHVWHSFDTIEYRYSEDGFLKMDNPIGDEGYSMTVCYDKQGRVLWEKEYSNTIDNGRYLIYELKCEYHNNGERASEHSVTYSPSGEVTSTLEAEFDEAGMLTKETREENGETFMTYFTEIIAVPGVTDDVLHTVDIESYGQEGEETKEYYSVKVQDLEHPGEKYWNVYSATLTKNGSARVLTQGIFDSEGHLQRIETAVDWNEDVTTWRDLGCVSFEEYDAQGRIVKSGKQYASGAENGMIYEYWEEE